MNWLLIKKFPKFAIAAAVLIVGNGLFFLWLLSRSPETPPASVQPVAAVEPQKQIIEEKVASLPAKMGWLAMVGSDLYDVSTGERIFQNWIGGIPQKLFYQQETNKLMVQVERGVIRYGIDGKKDAAMGETSPPAFSQDGKKAMFIRDGDIWLADVDWKAFAFINERQATKFGEFHAGFFAANLQLHSENALAVRHNNDFLHVDLRTGEIKKVKIPQMHLMKRRSPDGRLVFGEDRGKLILFDVEGASASAISGVQQRAVDFQWIDNDTCAFIHGGGSIVSVYDRQSGSVKQAATLPFNCNKMAGPSPDGRYVLCAGNRGIAVVDLEGKKASDFGMPAQHFGWVSNNTLIYSRDMPDTATRGTWLQTIGEPERQVMGDPYMVGSDGGAAVAPMPEVGLVVFGTREALFRMKPDGSALQELAKLRRPVGRIQPVEIWGE
ncbi:hypothetical protein FEM03_08055 [Phragmitibacter flavus]|uniref:WD40 repeat domain-containing protein n=1 Tax=Phragmitibacter flavus TaxID=2576071 RepID=A0A5R8KIM9_9BACT|nr:hypothetical protein [Phragmitibacter flavus]TLD71469.1 hypothetical protein FEM03_08055 [Phragmitibacter flavus]